jgi:hypothetical protein
MTDQPTSSPLHLQNDPCWEAIPEDLLGRSRWVVWRLEEGKKAPYSPVRRKLQDITARDAGCSFDQARAAYESGEFDGVGFVLTGDGVAAVDLDDCVTDGVATAAATEFLNSISPAYVELSPSGNGLHAFGLHEEIFSAVNTDIAGLKVEIYSTKRYMTVTGWTYLPWAEPRLREFRDGSLPIHSVCSGGDHVADGDAAPLLPSAAPSKGSGDLLECVLPFPQICLPNRTGMRNQAIFHLARYLKGKVPDASLDDLYPLVSEWHRQVISHIATKDLGDSWADFVVAWSNVSQPAGATLNKIISNELPELPAWMNEHKFGGRGTALLRLCLALEQHHFPEPFFLDCRTAANHVGAHFSHTANMLKAMVMSGLLDLVVRGTLNRASRYRIGQPSRAA